MHGGYKNWLGRPHRNVGAGWSLTGAGEARIVHLVGRDALGGVE